MKKKKKKKNKKKKKKEEEEKKKKKKMKKKKLGYSVVCYTALELLICWREIMKLYSVFLERNNLVK